MNMRSAALADDFARLAACAQNTTPLAIKSLHLRRLPLTHEMAVFVIGLERGDPIDLSALPPVKTGRAMPTQTATRARETLSNPE